MTPPAESTNAVSSAPPKREVASLDAGWVQYCGNGGHIGFIPPPGGRWNLGSGCFIQGRMPACSAPGYAHNNHGSTYLFSECSTRSTTLGSGSPHIGKYHLLREATVGPKFIISQSSLGCSLSTPVRPRADVADSCVNLYRRAALGRCTAVHMLGVQHLLLPLIHSPRKGTRGAVHRTS